MEVELESLRIAMESKLPETQWAQQRHDKLTTLDSQRLKALYHMQLYQARLARAFNKKVKHKSVKTGDWVLKQAKLNIADPRGKFRPNWEGPYLVKTVLSRGAVKLMDFEGNEFSEPTKIYRLKKYYV